MPPRPSLRAHLEIARFDHWFKNVFVLPGAVLALAYHPAAPWPELLTSLIVGLLAIGFIASSNYVINEVLDAPFDRTHPIKKNRPVPAGRVNVPLAYAQWILFMLIGMGLAVTVNTGFVVSLAALWIMGCIYNIPPVRSKDLPYVDVVSESINNPLRMLAGWYIVTAVAVPPLSLLISYWMLGAFFMAIKRFSEYREINSRDVAAGYRRSFKFYNEQRLLVSIMFYSALAMLFYGAFIMRYRLELILSFPLLSVVLAIYLHIAFRPNSPVQNPEGLYREKWLMLAVVSLSAVSSAVLFIDIPILETMFTPLIK